MATHSEFVQRYDSRQPLAETPVWDWAAFSRQHTDDSDFETVSSIPNAEATELLVGANAARAEEVLAALRRLKSLLGSD